MIPELLRYFLTGEMVNEFSNATTTQLFNPTLGKWDSLILHHLGLEDSCFGPIVHPGASVGKLRTSVYSKLGVGEIPVYAVAEHDTGSAVVAVPAWGPSLGNGAKAVIVKLGEKGAYYATSDQQEYVEGFPVREIVDPIGAGDGFAAGFLFCWKDW